MRNIMKIGVILLLLQLAVGIKAQDVQLTVNAPSKVEYGGQFRITYVVNKKGDFTGPSFKNFQLLAGPSVSTSTSMQIINGRTSSSTQKSYTYYLQASKMGKFKLPIATFKYKSKLYKSVPLNIDVVKSANPQQGRGGNQGNNANTATINNPEFKAEGLVFVKSLVSKRNVFVGEPILLTQKLYSKEQVSNITDFKEPSYTGFWKEDIDIGDLKLTKEVVNGQSYNVVVLQKALLFPQKSGELKVGSFKLDAVVQIVKKRRARDQFEQMMYGNIIKYYSNENVSLNSPVVSIKVKALPLPKPKGFNGVVGNFKMRASVDKTEVKANDAFNLKVKISGQGNVELLEAPKIVFPPDFEVYDPKITKSSKNTPNGVSGSKTFEYLIIPRNQGDYTITPFSFSFFNPQTEHYETCSSQAFHIHVLKGAGQASVVTGGSGVNRDEVRFVGKDIRHIMSDIGDADSVGSHSFNSVAHLLLLSLSPLLIIFIIILIKTQEKKRGDISLMRLKKATKMARKRMKMAQKYMSANDKKHFYEETSRALWGYLSDKFNVNLSELSMDKIRENLVNNGVSKVDIDEVSDIVQRCDFARYAPAEEQSKMSDLYERSLAIISKIEKSLK